jgi:hypothetical protein
VIKLAKPKKKKIVNKKDNKVDIPVLKTPTESRGGRLVIWIILIAMVLAAVGGLVAAIIINLK